MAASTSKPSEGCTDYCNQIIGKQTPRKTFARTGLPTKQIGTWSLETRHTVNAIHIGRGRFWGEISWQGTRPSSQKHHQETLQTHLRLDRNTTHWDCIGLGLQKTTSAFVNAKLCAESLETIPTHRWQTTALTLSERTNSIWHQEAIGNTGIDCPFTRW